MGSGSELEAVTEEKEELTAFKVNEKDGRPVLTPIKTLCWDSRGRFSPAPVVEKILRIRHFITFRDSNETYVYDPKTGAYRPNGETVVKELADKILGDTSRRNCILEVLELVKVRTYKSRSEVQCPSNLLVVQNGVLDIDSGKLLPFSPNIFVLSPLPVIHDPDVDCPAIKKFIKEIVHPEDVKVLQELAAYCLEKGYPIQKAFMLLGSGANGKSTYLDLLVKFLGMENVSAVALQDLEKRFAKADLYGKLANIRDDLSDKDLKYTGSFKILTGGAPIRAEKKFKDAFIYTNSAKLIFSANRLPSTTDDTDAFFRRWMIVVFPNKFEGDNADPNILDKLTPDKELSGLLNWALEGLERLRKNKKFSHSKSVAEVQDYYRKLSDSVTTFLAGRVAFDPTSELPKKSLYGEYEEYCKTEKLSAENYQTFCKKVLGHVRISATRPTIAGRRVECFKGLKLKRRRAQEVELFKKRIG